MGSPGWERSAQGEDQERASAFGKAQGAWGPGRNAPAAQDNGAGQAGCLPRRRSASPLASPRAGHGAPPGNKGGWQAWWTAAPSAAWKAEAAWRSGMDGLTDTLRAFSCSPPRAAAGPRQGKWLPPHPPS